MIKPRPDIAAMAPYAVADLSVPDGVPLVQIAQNESAEPPSPAALAAARAAIGGAARYPDGDWSDLRAAISSVHQIDPDLILCGAGSMQLIEVLIRTFAGPGDEVLAPAHTYAFFRTATQLATATYCTAPEENRTVSVNALLAAVTPRTRIVCVANPGNPTGTRLPAAELRRLREGLPGDVLLLLDEAYGEFAEDPDGPLFDLASRGDTVLTRTFSKAYGLAGMRVGWGVFPPAISTEMRKVLTPSNLSAASQAGAAAAMRDQAHMRASVAATIARRERFRQSLGALGLATPESHANFVLVPFRDGQEAASADRALRQRGVTMRGMGGYGLPECLRASIGSDAEMESALEALAAWQAIGEATA